tara:strand:- start:2006 stop:2497 length:492 start_codon:yes stop_codon:yes gene_type:complete
MKAHNIGFMRKDWGPKPKATKILAEAYGKINEDDNFHWHYELIEREDGPGPGPTDDIKATTYNVRVSKRIKNRDPEIITRWNNTPAGSAIVDVQYFIESGEPEDVRVDKIKGHVNTELIEDYIYRRFRRVKNNSMPFQLIGSKHFSIDEDKDGNITKKYIGRS